MYTVLVVDDEAIVCQGIKEFLESSDLNISQVLTAWNGYEALDYLRMEAVDLVLTDIQMDGMNGIELMESILSEKPEIPVVVISAYDAFEYAQRCIRLGARDYLIKPVQLQQLTEVVGRELSERDKKFKLLMEDSLKAKFSMMGMTSLRTYILNEMITVSFEATDYPYIFEQIDLALMGPYYSVFVIDLLWKENYSLRDRNLFKYATVNIIEELLRDWSALAFCGQGNRIVTILQFSDKEEVNSRMEAMTRLNLLGRKIIDSIKQYLHKDSVVGISPLRLGLDELPLCHREASDAIKWHGVYQNHNVFYAEDFSIKQDQIEVDWSGKTERIIERIKMGKTNQDVQQLIDQFIEEITTIFDSGDSTAGIPLSIAYRVYAMLLNMKETVGERYRELDPLVFFQFPMSTLELKKRMSRYLLEAAEVIHKSLIDHDQAMVQQAIYYIRNHYHHKGLKIQNVADHVHLSPNYLSYLFKLIVGETVWEFVTRLRMEEAKHLLMHTTKKRYEIADEVGYESPEHFTRVFKRYYGESPNMVRG